MLTDKEQEEIRRKLLGLEEEPPADGWSKIASEIKPDNPPGKLKWWLPAILLLLLLGTGVFYFSGERATTNDVAGLRKQEQVNSQEAKEATGLSAQEQNKETLRTKISPKDNKQLPASRTITPETGPVSNTINKQSSGKDAVEKVNDATYITKRGAKQKVLAFTLGKQKNNKHARADAEKNISPFVAVSADSVVAEKLPDAQPEVAATSETGLATKILPIPDSALVVSSPDSTDKTETVLPDLIEDNKPRGWFVGMTMATRYAFRSFEPGGADEIYITSLNKRKSLDRNRLGYEFGLNAGRSIKQNLYLETNLTLMKLREQVAYSYTTGKVDTLLKTQTSNGSYLVKPVYITGERELKSDFVYGGLRLGLTYFFLNRPQSRFNVTVAAGANLLVKGRTEEYFNGEYRETITFPSDENLLEQTNYNLLLGAGYNVSFYEKYELMVMPSLNYFLGSTYAKREPFGLKPYTMGISFQVRRRFGI